MQPNCVIMIPNDFETWRFCITEKCGIKLTKEFAKQRLDVYRSPENRETAEFIRLYGMDHYHRIVSWFEIIEQQG